MPPETPSKDIPEVPVSIFIVIVLYKMTPAESPTYRMLLPALAHAGHGVRVEVLLYDNTPGILRETLPQGVHYVAAPANSGLSNAYNTATNWAVSGNFTWLLTLDQDTLLPKTLISQLSTLAVEQQRCPKVAAIVPQLSKGEKLLSPIFKGWMLERYFPRGYQGLPSKAVYAFNSGSMIRVDALQKIGGYSPLFWLDHSDSYIYRRLELAGLRVFVAGSIALQHDLSIMNIETKMSLQRYRDALESGSAFCDLEMSWLHGPEETARLLRLYLAQIYRKRDPEFRRITLEVLWSRLARSRKRRVKDWLSVQQARISSYQGDQG